MNRRDFLESALSAATFIALPSVLLAKTPILPASIDNRISIDNMLSVSFPHVKKDMLRRRLWATKELLARYDQGDVSLARMGQYVDIDNKRYQSGMLSIPMAWSRDDENSSEADKVRIVTSLLRSSLDVMDFVFLEKLGTGKAVVSKDYRYQLGETCYHAETGWYVRTMFTAVAFTNPEAFKELAVTGNPAELSHP